MDFDETPAEAAFRAECRSFLDQHARVRTAAPKRSAATKGHDAEVAHARACRDWQRTKADAGWAGLSWPVAFGGRGLNGVLSGIFGEEEGRYDVPRGMFAQAIGMAGPTIIRHGTEEQKARFLDQILHGQQIWCQLFSEPGAGSDLAGLRTRAVRDGDEFVISGQKVWTSHAHLADWAMLLARTDPDVPKHRGISYFLLDMTAPGIDVRPLRQANGAAEFNEVFLEDVRVPEENVVGGLGDGWRIAQTTLTNERSEMGSSGQMVGFADVVGLARLCGVCADPVVRQRLAALYTSYELTRLLTLRARTTASRGIPPGPESSVGKLAACLRQAQQGDLVLAIQGVRGTLWGDDAIDDGFWQANVFTGQWGSRIGGGTEQVQRNIIGERILGLPPEPRLDKDVSFRALLA